MPIIIEKTNGQKERWFYLEEYAKLNNCTLQTVYNKINNNWVVTNDILYKYTKLNFLKSNIIGKIILSWNIETSY